MKDTERWNVARCIEFWKRPLPAASRRLKDLYDIDEDFHSDIIPAVIEEHFSLGHMVNRKRVSEYLDALKSLQPRQGFQNEDVQKRSVMNRII